MTIKNWIGGGSDEASSPSDWSPSGVPQPGDTLIISDGILNVTSGILAGDTLEVRAATGNGTVAAPTINVSQGGSINLLLDPPVASTSSPTVNVSGIGEVNASLPGNPEVAIQLTENIAAGSTLAGSVQVNRGTVEVKGLGTFQAQGTSNFSNDTATIASTMTGSGVIEIDQGSLEIAGSVAAGPTFQLLDDGALTIDNLSVFNASIADTTTGFADEHIDLPGVNATSYEYSNDVLQLYSGDSLVGSLALQAGNGTVYVSQGASGVVVTDGSTSTPPAGALPIHTSPTGGNANAEAQNFSIADTTTGQDGQSMGQAYTGPVAGLRWQIINITPDSLNISANVDNVFMRSGSGTDALAALGGTNVLDGGTGSNFLSGGNGTDTFFLDDRNPSADTWSTVVGLHAGDSATVWGVTPQDFGLSWQDGQGAAGYAGLTLHATAPGRPTASLTLSGYTSADLSNGRLAVSFGTDQASGSAYMYIHGES